MLHKILDNSKVSHDWRISALQNLNYQEMVC